MIVNRPKLSVVEQRRYERLQAQVVQQNSNIEYLAMMSDIDLPTSDNDSQMEETEEFGGEE